MLRMVRTAIPFRLPTATARMDSFSVSILLYRRKDGGALSAIRLNPYEAFSTLQPNKHLTRFGQNSRPKHGNWNMARTRSSELLRAAARRASRLALRDG